MPTIAMALATPYYLLRDGKQCIGPDCVKSRTGTECSAVYGFSNKVLYEHFRNESPLALTPYPLVKVYLRNQESTAHACVRLLVLDAPTPRESSLHAATIEAVLTAHLNQANQVVATHHLTFDHDAGADRSEEASI